MTGSYYITGVRNGNPVQKRSRSYRSCSIGWDKIFLILSFSRPAHCFISNPLAGVASTLQPYLAPGVLQRITTEGKERGLYHSGEANSNSEALCHKGTSTLLQLIRTLVSGLGSSLLPAADTRVPSSTVSSSGKNNQSSGNYSIRYKRQVSKTIG